MKLAPTDLRELADVAIAAATEAGEMVARSRPADVAHKAGAHSTAAQVVTDVDHRSEELILAALAPTVERFELGVLTEERDDDGGRLTADHFWCIDPLDGTLPFVEGVPGSAVSIALVRRDGSPMIGVIYDPVNATLLHAVAGAGAFRDGRPWLRPAPSDTLSVCADRSFLAMNHHDEVVNRLGQIARDMGLSGVSVQATAGAVMNACGVLANPPGCYFKYPAPSGGGHVWDFAATACLFREVGAVATDMRGEPLDLNRADATNMAHRGVLFATDEALAARIRGIDVSAR